MRSFFFFLIISVSLQAQTKPQEPIQIKATPQNFAVVMAIKEPTTRQVDTLIQLSIEYSFKDKDSCIILGVRSVEISKTLEDQSVHAKALLELGDTYRIFGDLDEGEKLLLKGKEIYQSLKDMGQVAYADTKLGALWKNRGDNQAAINYYLSALETWENLQDTQRVIMPLINLGAAFQSLSRLDKAEEYNLKALKLAEYLNDNRAKMYVLNNQALNYNRMADPFLSQDDPTRIDRDSGYMYLDKAYIFFEEALSIGKKMEDVNSIVRSLNNMSDVLYLKGAHNEALALAKEAETRSANLNDNNSVLSTKTMLTKIYHKLGQTGNAIKYGESALVMAKEKGMERHEAEASQQLYQVYKTQGKFERALQNLESYKAYNDKIADDKRNKAIAEVEEKYQTVQKEKQILTQQNEILELEKINARMGRQRNIFTGSAGLLVLFGYLGFQINRIRRERNDKKAFAEALIYAQEEDRKRIARDLHDGVGQSLLLIKKQLESSHGVTLDNQKMIASTLEEVRSISRDLHPFQLEKFGLTIAINDMIEKVAKASDLFITKEIDPVDGLLSEKAEINVFRTIQEALSNIVKHAEATAAKVTVHQKDNTIAIKIQDNGKGFDHELAVVKSKSLGLRTMYERIASLNGIFKIEKGVPKGAVIKIRVPVIKKTNK